LYQCWITKPYLAAKIMTEYIFFWMAAIVSFITAIIYASGVLPKGGFFWIGFPTRGGGLVRFGLISIDSNDQTRPDWSFSLDFKTSTRTISFMLPILVQYYAQSTATVADEMLQEHAAVLKLDALQVHPTDIDTRQANAAPERRRSAFRLLL
jgi:hypothetical protein